MASRVRNAVIASVLLLGSTLLMVLAGEVLLRVAVNPSDFLQATLVDDPALAHRIAPGTSGHDALGFRNRDVPPQVDVVAIGDSNTYGVSAPRDGSWPAQLARELGRPVYNMGLGGYGPLQYLHLARTTAKQFKPKVLVVGFYYGNDLMDAQIVAHSRPYWKDWKRSDGAAAEVAFAPSEPASPKRFAALRGWLSQHSMVYSVLRATVFQRFGAMEREAVVRASPPDIRWPWADTDGSVRTVFTPRDRLSVVDTDQPAVREGLDISKAALAALQDEATQQNVKLLVLLIPTKERAYCEHLGSAGTSLPASFTRLCTAETADHAELTAFLGQRGIAVLDATLALRQGIAQHLQLYPPDADGHPQTAGYGVIAKGVAQALRREHWLP